MRDETFSLPEISAMVLREMKSVAEDQLGQEVRKAVITVPAYFNDNQRQATKDAGRIAGLEVLRLLNEPTAAALAYGFGRGLNQRVAVYDLGGGTFDISILEIGKDVFEVLSTCGDTYLGGDDFDDRIIDLLADEFVAKNGINLRGDPFALEKLKLAAENAKKGLSVDDSTEVRIPDIVTNDAGESLTLERTLRNSEFTELVMDLLQRSFKVCDEALQQAGLVTRDLDGVILVGGPTRLPVVREAVATYFQQDPKTDVDPDEVVALGAAIHASSLVGGVDESDAFLLDVTPLSLRIGVAGGLAETVIERNTPVPIEQTRTFTTYQDDQESVQIKVYQGESRQAEENELLGQFEFAGFQKARRGEVKIDVTFEINSDGLVNVTAKDQDTGQQASTAITLSSGLSDEELGDILEASPADRVATATSDAANLLVPADDDEDELETDPPSLAASPSLEVDSGAPQRGDELELSAPSDPGDELELAAPGEGFASAQQQVEDQAANAMGEGSDEVDPNEATNSDLSSATASASLPPVEDEDLADLELDEELGDELFETAGVDLTSLGDDEK